MALPDIFSPEVSGEICARIDQLKPESQPQWGKMSAAQMLAHCNVTYEMVYEDKHKKPGGFMKFILKTLVKPKVVGEKPYARNSPTAPQFLVSNMQDFTLQQQRLKDHIRHTQALGGAAFDGKASHSFGVLNRTEWNNMFYKHLDHHLTQFGV